RLLARQDFEQCVALRGIGTLVDDDLHGAITLVHRRRPMPCSRHPQSVEPHLAEITLLDLPCPRRFAETVCRQGVELARASVRAIAVGELGRLDAPFDCHGRSPIKRSRYSFVLAEPTNLIRA